MKSGIRFDSVQQGQRDQQKRTNAETNPHVLEEGLRWRRLLRRSLQLDDGEMPAASQVVNREFNVLASTTAHLRLRAGARRTSRPMSARLKSLFTTGRSSKKIDLVRRRGVQRVVSAVSENCAEVGIAG